ncbi:MAG: tRNA lysidine(34) synthetase TilS [Verrucomicrobiota bacterium JB022]|nr:tRNA lysidine(34) synthetase TilS [Verrucomicrobiota bacterium JB022]
MPSTPLYDDEPMDALDFDWCQAAEALLREVPVGQWERQALAWLEPRQAEPWVVACSGGADSMALLLLTWAAFPEARSQLMVVNYNHGLRPEAEEETIFVRGIGAALGIKALTNQEVPVWPETPSEAQLRKVRFDFLRAIANSHGATNILQGHQADDVLESFLLRAGRGSSLRALTGPRPLETFAEQPAHVRPLLTVPRERLREALRALDIPWREDQSNRDARYRRNRVREEVIPVWRQALPHEPLAGVLAIREELADAEAVVEAALDAVPVDYDAPELCARAFSSQTALRRWALQRWLHRQDLGETVTRAARAQLLEAWIRPVDLTLSFGPTVLKAGHGKLTRLTPRLPCPPASPFDACLASGAVCFQPDGRVTAVHAQRVTPQLWERFRQRGVEVQREAWIRGLPDTVVQVRNWQPGDAYRPLGAPGRKKLQDWFTDRKIPERERHRLPVFLNAQNDLLWVPGLPPAQVACLQPQDVWALKLTYCPSSADYNLFSHARESEQSTE